MRAAPWFGVLLLLACGNRRARRRTTRTVFVDELTWTELRDQVRAGKTTIIVPIGGTEQNGPHMVLGKHNARARALAGKIAQTLGNALVAPVLAYVPEGEHRAADGAHALSRNHHRARGHVRAGHRVRGAQLQAPRLSRHRAARRSRRLSEEPAGRGDRLNKEWSATTVRVHAIEEYYRVAETAYAQALRSRGYSRRRDRHPRRAGRHVARAGGRSPASSGPNACQAGDEAGAADGVYGDPRRASAELGQLGVDAIVAATVDAIRQRHRPPLGVRPTLNPRPARALPSSTQSSRSLMPFRKLSRLVASRLLARPRRRRARLGAGSGGTAQA